MFAYSYVNSGLTKSANIVPLALWSILPSLKITFIQLPSVSVPSWSVSIMLSFPYLSVKTLVSYVLSACPLPPIFIAMLPLHSVNSLPCCLSASPKFDNVIVWVTSSLVSDGLGSDITLVMLGVSPESITPFLLVSPSSSPSI